MGYNGIFVLLVLLAVAAFFLSVKNKNKGSQEELGQLVINTFMSSTKTTLVFITVFLLMAEAFIAGSIHKVGQTEFSDIGRTLIHLMISLLGLVGIFGLPSATNELIKSKYSANSIFTILILVVLSTMVPISNIFLIGHALGQPELLSQCFKYLIYGQETWLDYLYYENLPETYKPFKSIETILLVVMISNILSFLAYILEALYGASKVKIVAANNKEKDSDKNKDKDKNKEKDSDKPIDKPIDKPKPAEELVTFKNNAHIRTIGENGLRAGILEYLLPDNIKDILKDNQHPDYMQHFNKISEGVNLLSLQWNKIDQKYAPSFSAKIAGLSAKTMNPANKDALKKEIWKFLTAPLAKTSVPGEHKGADITEAELLALGLVNPN
jgi:hypothetical protein